MISKITARHFRTIKDVSLQIPAVKTINFVGPKGSGKSSLFEAVAVAYYGKGRTKNIQTLGQTENYSVAVDQTIANEKWHIERADKKVGQSLAFEHNGKSYESKKITESQEKFDELFGCSVDVFMNTFYFQQGEADVLFTGSGGPRMELMRRIFNFDLFKKCAKDADARLKTIVKTVNELNGAMKEIKERVLSKESIKELKDVIAAREATKKKTAEQISEINKRLAAIPSAEESDKAADKISELDTIINKMKNKLREIQFDEAATLAQIDELKKKGFVYTPDKDDELAAMATKESEHTQNISELDHNIKRKERVLKDAREDLERVTKQSDVCPTCGREGYDAHHKKAVELDRQIAALVAELEALNTKVAAEAKSATAIRATYEGLSLAKRLLNRIEYNKECEAKTAERDKFAAIVEKFKQSDSERESLQDELEAVSDLHTAAIREAERAKMQIKDSDDAQKALDERRDTIETLTLDKRKYTILLEAFGNSGTPKYMFENVIPVWQNKANEIIAQLDDAHRVKIVSDESAINFLAVSQFGDKEYADLSGGEKAIFTFSVRLALTYILIDLFGMKYRVIWLDEMFGAIDPHSREAVLKMIKMLSKDFEQIFIISHNEDSDIAEAVFRFSKGDDGYTRVEAA